MNRYILIIVVVIISVPLLTPLAMNLYMYLLPDQALGTRGEWLSFLGGYSGGFVAFLSAWFLFRLEKNERNQTHIYLSTKNTSNENLAKISLIYTKKDDFIFNVDDKKVVSNEDYPAIKLSLKNVSTNFAKGVNIRLGNLQPWFHIGNQSNTSKYDTITDLDVGEELELNLHIDPVLLKDGLIFTIESKNISNLKNKQKAKLHVNQNGWSFEQLT
ncbi:MAG: hypothetical protein HRT54_07515 [Colwellia sp.]|nr:hypothetical protein [Colwellia sp.]